MCATFIGTHAYMSPERLGGKPYSFASDIWSLGITLVECALGQFPYTVRATTCLHAPLAWSLPDAREASTLRSAAPPLMPQL